MRLVTRRLLTAVKSGSVLGAALDTRLADAGVLAGFQEALSMRSEVRSLSANIVAMDAIVLSVRAINAVFTQASAENATACKAVALNAVAMSAVCASLNSLVAVNTNPVAWALFIASTHFQNNEVNKKSAIALLAGVVPSAHASVLSMIDDDVSMALIGNSPRAMMAMVAAPSAITSLSTDSVAMGIVADNVSAITTVSASASAMPIIAESATAMSAIVTRTIATGIIANSSVAIKAVYKVPTAWTAFKAGAFFATYLKSTVANLAGLNPASFATMNAIIDDTVALTAVNLNLGASQALSADATAVAYLSTHTNFTIMAGNSSFITALSTSGATFTTFTTHANFTVAAGNATTMGILTASAGAMAILAGSTGALTVMFASSVAKGAIFVSTVAVSALKASATAATYLGSIQTLLLSVTVPLANVWVPFASGLPAKILMVSYRQQGIGAIETPVRFKSPESVQLSMVGTAAIGDQIGRPHIGVYSNLEFNTTAISAITGSGIGYINMM